MEFGNTRARIWNLATRVLAYGTWQHTCSHMEFGNTRARIWNAMQSEFEVNVSISKFKIAFKIYLQEHSLQLKYTK